LCKKSRLLYKTLTKTLIPNSFLATQRKGNQTKENETDGFGGTHRAEEKFITVLVGKPEGKESPVRPRCRRKVGIKTDLKKEDWMMQNEFL
jgi:hypothetical protein